MRSEIIKAVPGVLPRIPDTASHHTRAMVPALCLKTTEVGALMPWFAVDDTFHSHRKRLAAGNTAVGVWTACGSYCGQHLTDGHVPGEVVKLYGRPADASVLVRVRLWHAPGHDCERCPQPEPGTYVFHDYLDYNPSREEVETERRRTHEAKSRAGRAGGIASGVSRRRNGQGPADAKQERSRNEADAKQEHPPDDVPASDLLEAEGKQNEAPSPPLPSPVDEANASSVALRADVERICGHLADRIVANGSRRPTVGKAWRDAARLMLDRDGRTEAQVHTAIDWCQDDDFWRGNILSMPKLRQRYDQLRLQASRSRDRRPDVGDPYLNDIRAGVYEPVETPPPLRVLPALEA